MSHNHLIFRGRPITIDGSYHLGLTTDHPKHLGGYDRDHPYYYRILKRLTQILETHLTLHQHVAIHTGLNRGIDLLWADTALEFKEHYPDRIAIAAHIPHSHQYQHWSKTRDIRLWNLVVHHRADIVYHYVFDDITTQAQMYQFMHQDILRLSDTIMVLWDFFPHYLNFDQSRAEKIVLNPRDY